MRLATHLPVALAVVFTLAACGDSGSSEPVDTVTDTTTSPASSGDPSGTWLLVSGPVEPIPGWDVTVTIEGDSITGTAACNGYGGTVDWADGEMDVGELGWTEMGCEPDVQALEQAFLTSLGAGMAYTVTADHLELVNEAGTWVFEPQPEVPTAELVGTTWVLDGYVDGESVSNESGMERAFVELSADGTLVGATNCRTLTGEWTTAGAEVVFTTFAADGECPDDAASDLDSRIITVLGDGFRADIDGDRLTVTSRGDEGLTFRAG